MVPVLILVSGFTHKWNQQLTASSNLVYLGPTRLKMGLIFITGTGTKTKHS